MAVRLKEIVPVLKGEVLVDIGLDREIRCVGAADLMSDVLALAEPGSLLLTGLCNPQVVRTAEMADLAGIVLVRGKHPPQETVNLAREKGIPLILTPYTMYEASGLLYRMGLASCDISDRLPWLQDERGI